ncbi:MAG TPA: methylmalonyl Co-A mutase-associated GTPase MeaB [Opitutus sp.]|nr:methylmalonyl Co-A mutase-associated GTPase MeaB [Opitutus sp.]
MNAVPQPTVQSGSGSPSGAAENSVRPDWVPENAGPAFATRVLRGESAAHEGIAAGLPQRRRALTLDDYGSGVGRRDPTIVARAITLVESNAPAHQVLAQALLARLLPHTGGSRRIGITGIPGAGKSTFIEALGCHLVAEGHRVAVLAVDPSSSVSGGSILADKIRMEKLSRLDGAFIRPSPSGGSLGGVTRKTREAVLVCEAAGFDVVIVETVGVGQNEVAVRAMVDFFLVLMIAGAGDEMQGIKKGVIELADALVINKADGDNRTRATAAQAEMQRVLHYLLPTATGWATPALLASARTGEGIAEVWRTTEAFFSAVGASGELEQRRRTQAVEWMHALIAESLRTRFYGCGAVKRNLAALEEAVAVGRTPAFAAALEALALAEERAERG